MCIDEVYLMFLNFYFSGAKNITVEYMGGISEGNIKEEYEFIVIPLFSFIVYGPAFTVYW